MKNGIINFLWCFYNMRTGKKVMILFLYPCGEKCALYLSFYKHFYRVFSLQISSYALCERSNVTRSRRSAPIPPKTSETSFILTCGDPLLSWRLEEAITRSCSSTNTPATVSSSSCAPKTSLSESTRTLSLGSRSSSTNR